MKSSNKRMIPNLPEHRSWCLNGAEWNGELSELDVCRAPCLEPEQVCGYPAGRQPRSVYISLSGSMFTVDSTFW